MAQSSEGLLGNYSGRLSNLVYYKVNGKTRVRTLSPGKMPPAIGAKKKAQEDFAMVMKVMQAVKYYIKTGFHDVSGGRTAFHTALSVNIKRMRADANPGKLKWLLPSQGSRAGASEVLATISGTKATVNWGPPYNGQHWRGNDMVMLLALNTTTLSEVIDTRATRNQSSHSFELPPMEAGEEVQIFISFFNPLPESNNKNPENISTAQLVTQA